MLDPLRRRANTDLSDVVDVLSFLKSPMILMALFSLVLILGIPYLTDNSTSSHLSAGFSHEVTQELTRNSGRGNKSRVRGHAEEITIITGDDSRQKWA